jgi:hypothetical protein
MGRLIIMSLPARIALALGFAIGLLFAGIAAPGQAAPPRAGAGLSPALCGPGDTREPGIQGDVPAGQTANYNCGVRLVGQLPRVGNVQGVGKCAYVRSRNQVFVVDVSDPAKPVEVGSVPVQSGSETMRVVVTDKRAILVSGSSVYDISDCLHPVLAGEIKWPPLALPGVPIRLLPHDIRVNREGTKVYATFGLWEADITNLKDPNSWKVTDYRCEMAAQEPGPWAEVHRQALKAGLSLCADATKPNPVGANYTMGASPLQASLLWPQFSHSPDLNADDTLMYVGDQAGGTSGIWAPVPKVRIIDLRQNPPKIVGEVEGSGHGLDWFRAGGRDYVLHSNEGGTAGIMGQPNKGDTCKPYPRPSSLGWGFEAFVSDVTQPAHAHHVSMLHIAINDPEFCSVRKASGRDPWIAYHLIDSPLNPHFAMVNFGTAGFRIFDIRQPAKPSEVAYFNHGLPVHGGVGYYDAARGLIYAAGSNGFWVLELEPQVRARLGL